MKRGFVLLIASLFGIVCAGCRQAADPQDTALARNVPKASPAEVSERTERTVINKAGFKLPIELPDEKEYHATTVMIEGQLVTVLNSPFFPEKTLMVRTPKFWEDGDVEYKVSQIIEFTDTRKRPYCYQIFVYDERRDPKNTGVPTFFSYRDDDGDGVFETLGEACKVPDWVRRGA
jgi:hypothetical protein